MGPSSWLHKRSALVKLAGSSTRNVLMPAACVKLQEVGWVACAFRHCSNLPGFAKDAENGLPYGIDVCKSPTQPSKTPGHFAGLHVVMELRQWY